MISFLVYCLIVFYISVHETSRLLGVEIIGETCIIKVTGEPAMISYVHIIRHGVTTGNARKELYGASEVLLAEEGKEELKRLAAEGIYPEDDTANFYTTGMIRTEQTFEIIYGNRSHQVAPLLKEMDFGELENVPLDEIMANPVYAKWMEATDMDTPAPGGESFNELGVRIMAGFEEVMERHHLLELAKRHSGKPANTIIICHAGTILSIMINLFPEEFDLDKASVIPHPGHGYSIKFEDGKATGYERI